MSATDETAKQTSLTIPGPTSPAMGAASDVGTPARTIPPDEWNTVKADLHDIWSRLKAEGYSLADLLIAVAKAHFGAFR